MITRHKFYTSILALVFTANVLSAPIARTYQETRERLASLRSVTENRDVLAVLFENGDARIDDLIKAIDDPDPKISLRAQKVIRYLGNPFGMKALEGWYSGKTEIVMSGPIPIPLTQRDYEMIASQSTDNNFAYVYALALDGSERARRLLDLMMKAKLPDGSSTRAALDQLRVSRPRKVMIERSGLANLVLRNAFFVAPVGKPYASAKLVALNQAKNKALIEVSVNLGPLAEEVYHVVIQKRNKGWQFFSITQVVVS